MKFTLRPPETCPHCGRKDVQPSIPFASLDFLLSWFLRPYRCLRCDRRYWCVRTAK